MRRTLIALVAAVPFVFGTALAQERPDAARFEIGAFPVGGVFFSESSSAVEPAFGNFALGATLTYNVNRWIAFEGEVGNAIGIRQDLTWQDRTVTDILSPCLYAYSGGLIIHPFTGNHAVVPYAAVGAGGMTLLCKHGKTHVDAVLPQFDAAGFQGTATEQTLDGRIGGGGGSGTSRNASTSGRTGLPTRWVLLACFGSSRWTCL